MKWDGVSRNRAGFSGSESFDYLRKATLGRNTWFQPSRRSRAKETVLGDSYLSGEHGVSANLTTEVTRSIDGLPERFKALSDSEKSR